MIHFSDAANSRSLRVKPIRTRLYTPSTKAKAENLIQTAIREWANARLYQNSAERLSNLGASQPPRDLDPSAQRAPTSCQSQPVWVRIPFRIECEQPPETPQQS